MRRWNFASSTERLGVLLAIVLFHDDVIRPFRKLGLIK
jgi:hypothetical protein